MIVNFHDLFNFYNGMLSAKAMVRINGITFGPGVSFQASGISVGGFSLNQLVGKNLRVQLVGGVYQVEGYFN